jgi:hypothetical protein
VRECLKAHLGEHFATESRAVMLEDGKVFVFIEAHVLSQNGSCFGLSWFPNTMATKLALVLCSAATADALAANVTTSFGENPINLY